MRFIECVKDVFVVKEEIQALMVIDKDDVFDMNDCLRASCKFRGIITTREITTRDACHTWMAKQQRTCWARITDRNKAVRITESLCLSHLLIVTGNKTGNQIIDKGDKLFVRIWSFSSSSCNTSIFDRQV